MSVTHKALVGREAMTGEDGYRPENIELVCLTFSYLAWLRSKRLYSLYKDKHARGMAPRLKTLKAAEPG